MTGYDDRARNHIRALASELKDQAAAAPEPAQPFMNGMITGIASTVEIIEGGSAEDALITVNQRLAAAVGQAYLDGKLPEKPTPGRDDDGRLLSSNEVKGIQAWMAMDVHQALGWSRAQGLAHQGRTSWGEWWAELCSGVRQLPAALDTLARVRQLCEMTIEQSMRTHAIDQARDTLAILDRTNVASPTSVMTTVGAPVTTHVTSGITAPPVQCWHTEADTPCTSTQCNQPDRLRMGDYGDVPNDRQPDGPARATDADEVLRRDRRDAINVLLECLTAPGRGGLTNPEADRLRQYIEAEMSEADTARTVALGNLRHVRTIIPEMEAQKAAIDRVREALQTTFMAGPDAVTVVRASSIRAALDPPKDPS